MEASLKRAFSLVEILVVVAILSCCLIPLYSVFSFGIRGTENITASTEAVTLATDLMELIVNKPSEEFIHPRSEKHSRGKYGCELTITPGDGMSEVIVTVSRDEKSVKLVTIVPY